MDYLPGQYGMHYERIGLNDYHFDSLGLAGHRPYYAFAGNQLATGEQGSNGNYYWMQQQHSGQHLMGQKQYELTNHLGNVQVTVSDLPYKHGDDTMTHISPALKAVYDYYPFGSPMPGRTIMDTSRKCVDMTRLDRVWKAWEMTQAEIYTLSLINYHLDGEGQVFIDDNGAVEVEIADEHAVFYMELQDSLNNGGEMVLYVDWLKEFSEKGFLLTLQGMDVTGEMRVFYQKHYKNPEDVVYLSIADSFTNVSVGIQGNLHFRIDNISYVGGSWVNEEVLVRVCDDGGDRYRFGFNGMLKDNEWAGMGTHLDFGARIYDSRVGRFLSLDPLMNKFPYQSPYVFAGSNPILLIDEEGEEKKVYYYVIDMRDNTIKIPTAPSIENGLYMRNVRPYNGLDYYTYHDYSINQVTLIDENGKKQVYYSKPFNIDYKKDRLKTIGPSTTYARIRTGEINLNFLDNPTKEWSTIKFEGGLQLTSKSNAPWIGRDNRYNKSGKGESVYVDDLLSMLTMVSNGNFIKNGNELIRHIDYLNKALSNTNELQNNKRNSSDKDTLLYFQDEDGQRHLKFFDKDSLDKYFKPAEKTKDGKYFNSNNVYEKK